HQPPRPSLARLGRSVRPGRRRRLRLPRPGPPRPLGRRDPDARSRPRSAPTRRRPGRLSHLSGVRRPMALKSLFDRFRKGLAKTAALFNPRSWFGRKVDQSFLDDLEARLIQGDVGVSATSKIIDRVRDAYADRTADEDLVRLVKDELKSLLA